MDGRTDGRFSVAGPHSQLCNNVQITQNVGLMRSTVIATILQLHVRT